MTDEKKCPQCSAPLPPGSPEGLCPACLLKQGLASGTAGYSADSRTGLSWQPPTLDALAPAFPELELLEFIGRGGMGAVYKAREKQLDRIVALKILPPEIGRNEDFARRFAREAQAMARLNHPNIVAIHSSGQRGELYYFLMEYVDGLSLRRLLDGGRVSPREALAIVPQICDALQYAHDRGIVHRDIKPENILLNRQGQVKIADFGLAKLVGAEPPGGSSAGERIMGTPSYMAPEQTEHPNEVDHRADIFSLGVVFYQMLTGELPTGRFDPPSHKVSIDVRLDEVVLRTLEHEPDRRYQHASDVRTHVETIVATASGGPAPGAGPTTGVAAPAGADGRTPNKELMRQARERLGAHWGHAILAGFLFMVLSGLVGAIPYVGTCAGLVVGGPLDLGVVLFFLAFSRGAMPEIDTIFQGFRNFGRAFGAYIIMNLLLLAWAFGGAVLGAILGFIPASALSIATGHISILSAGSMGAIFVGGAGAVVGAMVAATGYGLTFYLLADHPKTSPFDVVFQSWRVMRGRKWKAFCLMLRFLGWALLSLLSCGIGFLWVFPYMVVSWARFYDDLRPSAGAPPTAQPVAPATPVAPAQGPAAAPVPTPAFRRYDWLGASFTVVLHGAVLIGLSFLLAVYVLPIVLSQFNDFGVKLPLATEVAIDVTHTAGQNWVIVFPALLLLDAGLTFLLQWLAPALRRAWTVGGLILIFAAGLFLLLCMLLPYISLVHVLTKRPDHRAAVTTPAEQPLLACTGSLTANPPEGGMVQEGAPPVWRVRALVAEEDIARVVVGQKARITLDAFRGRTFNGEVHLVGDVPHKPGNMVTYAVLFSLTNADPDVAAQFKEGMSANVEFEALPAERASEQKRAWVASDLKAAIVKRLDEVNVRAKEITVTVSPDLARASCALSGLQELRGDDHDLLWPIEGSLEITRIHEGRWQVQGHGDLGKVNFAVDTAAVAVDIDGRRGSLRVNVPGVSVEIDGHDGAVRVKTGETALDADKIVVNPPPAPLAAADKPKLEFLATIPELYGLDLNVTEDALKKMVAEKGLRSVVSEEKDGRTYHVYRADGENVIVMFRDGKCSGIQRMMKDPETAKKLFAK